VINVRTRQLIKYVLMLETLPLAGDEFHELMENTKRREKRINVLREKLLMPRSYYPYKQP
jgi:hypothetical protein